MPHFALVTARAARDLDQDIAPLEAALRAVGATVTIADWDDPAADWSRFDFAVLRSTWDYTARLDEFLDWAARAARTTQLINPLAVVRWNTDKHYLAELSRAGIATVPGVFFEPDEAVTPVLDDFLAQLGADAAEFVVKPCVGAGSRDAQRYGREERDAALAHAGRLLDGRRSVLLQPYLRSVDEYGETALIFFGGEFSHAIRKGPLLRRGNGPVRALFATEHITPRTPDAAERALAQAALAALPFTPPPAYARIDLIRDDDDAPRVLELELTEPSLFFAHDDGAADRFAAVLMRAARN